MPPFTRLLCLLGRHRRSRGRARRTAAGWRSRCRGCGILMEKAEGGSWHVVAPPDGRLEPEPNA